MPKSKTTTNAAGATQPAETAHTPGPWDDASNYPEFASVRIFAGTKYIATVGNSDDSKEQTEFNARLIAAAPDLLALARVVAARPEHPHDDRGKCLCSQCTIIREAKELAEKATGGAR